jgi:ankyrin repeat protein
MIGHSMMAVGQPTSRKDLLNAVTAKDVDTAQIQALLSRGADIDARDAAGRTALFTATHGNRIEVARILIEAGADVNAKDRINDSPYLYAGARGHHGILTMTLAHGADLRSTKRYDSTALIPAWDRGHVDTARNLIDIGWTALLGASILGDGPNVNSRSSGFW